MDTSPGKLEIIVKHMSPPGLKVIGVLIFAATNFKLITFSIADVNPFILLSFNVIAFAIWTAREIVVIDIEGKQIREGYKILGISHTEKFHFSSIEKIFVNRISTYQIFRHFATENKIHDHIYKAFLKTNNGDKICVGQMRDKDDLIIKLKQYNQMMNTIIFDNTLSEPIAIN